MAYIVTRNKDSGFVAFVEKQRVPVAGGQTRVRNVGYVCGLGVMTQSEFEEFKAWAHAITHQETRKEAVLACPRVIVKKEKTEATVAAAQQKKTTVKAVRKAKTVWKPKNAVIKSVEDKAVEREKFRSEYEEKKKIKVVKPVKDISEGIKFSGRKTLGVKRRILSERITEVGLRIANSEADIRRWQKGQAGRVRIPAALELISEYKGMLRILKKQRSELRR